MEANMKTTILYKGHYREASELMRELASLVMESSDQAHEDSATYKHACVVAFDGRQRSDHTVAMITKAHARKTQAWASLAYAQGQWRQALKQLGLGC